MIRPQTKAAIKEDINHVLEELWGLEPEDAPGEIFRREAKLGTDYVLVLSK